MWRRSSPHIVARSVSSGGSSTKQGAASRSTLALKYALRMSMKLSWTRLWDLGSHTGWCWPQRVMVRLITVRSASIGGAGAKYVSPERSSRFICRATNRERLFGFSSSPLFVSSHRVEIGGLPFFSNALRRGTLIQTPFLSKKSTSTALASKTKLSLSTWPATSCLKRPE